MKRLLAFALILCLMAASAALAEGGADLRLGYIAPSETAGERYETATQAFLFAAKQKGVQTNVRRYDPPKDGAKAEAEATDEDADAEDPAALALRSLIEDGVSGVTVVPTSLEQAVQLVEQAEEAGVPIVIEGIDLSSAYPPTPDPDDVEQRPYVAAVTFGDSAAYTAAKWLEDRSYSPLMFHCALPESDPNIESGIQRALAEAEYLEFAGDFNAPDNSASGGREAILSMYNSYTMFYCVLADSAALGAGCQIGLKEKGDSMPIAAIDDSPESLLMLKDGTVDMLASAPASVEGVRSFQALYDYLTNGTLPENETRLVQLGAIASTAVNNAGWIAGNDYEAAYALAYPEEAEAGETAEPQ